jgi:hypothetical protein
MTKKTILIGIASFLIVLFTMPLRHALIILMVHLLDKQFLYYASFAMGVVGLVLTIIGVFVNGDTRQTLFGLFGGLLFWTGWIEFGYVYFANRYGVHPLEYKYEIITILASLVVLLFFLIHNSSKENEIRYRKVMIKTNHI